MFNVIQYTLPQQPLTLKETKYIALGTTNPVVFFIFPVVQRITKLAY